MFKSHPLRMIFIKLTVISIFNMCGFRYRIEMKKKFSRIIFADKCKTLKNIICQQVNV